MEIIENIDISKKRSKIVVTIGPSSNNYEIMKDLILNGATTIRANFSHGSHEEQKSKMDIAKQIQKELDLPISIMLDTKGPEIRVGKIKDGGVQIKANTLIKVYTTDDKFKNFIGDEKELAIGHGLHNDVKIGNKVLFDDGKLTSLVKEINKDHIIVKTVNGHFLKTNKRINVPGVDLSLKFLAEKDIDDIKFGIEQNVDYIAASFVNSANDVKQLRKLLKDNDGEHIQIISKIESSLGIKNIDEIIEISDSIMVARGDLGLEIPYWEVPYWEKQIIRKCRNVGKPVIVATQMLDSMEKSPQPTRAEVSDVYWATELGADATMLSGESANGDFPVEAVKVMATINVRAEKEFYNKLYYPAHLSNLILNPIGKHSQLAGEVALKVMDGSYKFAVILSETGNLLREIARFRPNTNIIGIIHNPKLINSFGINNSVFMSVHSPKIFHEIEEDLSKAREILLPYHPLIGDKYIVVEKNKITKFVY